MVEAREINKAIFIRFNLFPVESNNIAGMADSFIHYNKDNNHSSD